MMDKRLSDVSGGRDHAEICRSYNVSGWTISRLTG